MLDDHGSPNAKPSRITSTTYPSQSGDAALHERTLVSLESIVIYWCLLGNVGCKWDLTWIQTASGICRCTPTSLGDCRRMSTSCHLQNMPAIPQFSQSVELAPCFSTCRPRLYQPKTSFQVKHFWASLHWWIALKRHGVKCIGLDKVPGWFCCKRWIASIEGILSACFSGTLDG